MTPYADRVRRLRAKTRRLKADAYLLTSPPNIRYITGFTGEDSAVLVTPEEVILLTDGRFGEQAVEECPGARVVLRHRGLAAMVATVARKQRLRRILLAAPNVSLAFHQQLAAGLSRRRLQSTRDHVLELRMIKDAGEIAAIRRAIATAEKAFSLIDGALTEQDYARKLEDRMRRLGAQGAAFETIAAIGPRAALPHARPTKTRISGDKPMLVDWGASQDGYSSDLTRVRSSRRICSQWGRVYRIVSEAALKAMAVVRPGISAHQVDTVARRHIERAGYGGAFLHSLGHGVGLQVHELPAIAPRSRVILKTGMVFTIEPGIYIPGELGIRIEDMMLVIPSGGKRLTRLARRAEAWRLA